MHGVYFTSPSLSVQMSQWWMLIKKDGKDRNINCEKTSLIAKKKNCKILGENLSKNGEKTRFP